MAPTWSAAPPWAHCLVASSFPKLPDSLHTGRRHPASTCHCLTCPVSYLSHAGALPPGIYHGGLPYGSHTRRDSSQSEVVLPPTAAHNSIALMSPTERR